MDGLEAEVQPLGDFLHRVAIDQQPQDVLLTCRQLGRGLAADEQPPGRFADVATPTADYLDALDELVDVGTLQDIAIGIALYGAADDGRLRVGAQHDDAQARHDRLKLPDSVDTVAIRQCDIE